MKLTRMLAAAVMVMGLGLGTANAAWCPPAPPPAPAPIVVYPPPPPLPSPQYLGSEDYFQGHGGDPRDFVIGLYSDVLHRAPSEAEIQRWVTQLGNSADGVTLAREFLTFAQGELATNAPPPPIVVVTPPPPPPPAHHHSREYRRHR
jgi:hypothetical protein